MKIKPGGTNALSFYIINFYGNTARRGYGHRGLVYLLGIKTLNREPGDVLQMRKDYYLLL